MFVSFRRFCAVEMVLGVWKMSAYVYFFSKSSLPPTVWNGGLGPREDDTWSLAHTIIEEKLLSFAPDF